ncbi:MAG TPA: BolA family transcriptional regulator [Deltaproteobacteria bacterium]|nr:BolA family transcriptional regulator [Candidatus Binatota bacterium]HIL12265.1 BolA family transcriptional regulator [Deltaproteobacteria bacterium]
MEASEIEKILGEAIAGAQVQAEDTKGNSGDHFRVIVVAEVFEGLGMVARHRVVYEALGDNMRERIHALTMETLTPEQYRSQIVSLEEG